MTLSIPGYQTGELLGYGSHGEVWSAMCRRTGEHVALKRVQLSSEQASTAIRGEASLLAALTHPNIIGLREFIEAGDCAVLVMELAAGGSLTDLLARRRRLTPAEVGVCFSDLAAALAYAHDEGVLHGDVSAANVLFTADGRAKLADLGLARLFGQAPLGLGTPTYLDPVVAAGGAAGAASDVFSLAAVALHALTGDGPWASATSNSAQAVLAVAATAEIADFDERLAGSPPELVAALARALDAEPGRRGTAAELALDLRAAVLPVPVTVHAGRLGPVGGRHYAARESGGQPPKAGTEPAPLDRPDFLRPDPEGGPSADLTHASRSNIRALLTPQPAHRARWARVLGNRRALTALTLAGLACAAVGVVASFVGHVPASALLRHGDPDANSPSGPVSPVVTSTSASAGPSASAVDVADGLRVIDSRRSEAFATGQANLLSEVYDSPVLLAQDSAQLRRILPAGCGAAPLRTTYRDLVIRALAPDRVDVTVTVSTSAAELTCDGRVAGHIVATAPTAMAISLSVQPGGGYRIKSQKPA